jgi:hypothetical protein
LGAPRYALLMAALVASLSGCSSGKKTAIYDHETFGESQTFSRTYPVTDVASCEAARRALLSQGYIITSSDPKIVSGHKSFQQTGDTHMEISFNVVCAPDSGQGATMFANALQDRYALKKTNNSASLGVGVLGSVSMPIGSTDDSMVKVASETVTSDKFYDRYFALVEMFLPKEAKPKAHADDAPKGDLGVPEPTAQKPGAQAAPVVPAAPLHPAAAEPGVPATVVSPAAGVAVVPAAVSAGAVAAHGAAAEGAPAASTAAAAPAAAVTVAPASVAPAPAVAAVPAATGASVASVAPAAESAAGATVVPASAPAVLPAASSTDAVAAAPAVLPVPVAPAVPAQLAPVDETVQSQTVVPPADIDAPISATQASTP